MSHLQYYGYEGWARRPNKTSGTVKPSASAIASNAQAKVCPLHTSSGPITEHTIAISSASGCDPMNGVIHREINAQIDQAFANVDMNLKDAGGKG